VKNLFAPGMKTLKIIYPILLMAGSALLISCSVGFGVGGSIGGSRSRVGMGVGVGVGGSSKSGERLVQIGDRLHIAKERQLPAGTQGYQRGPALAYGRGNYLLTWQQGWHGAGGNSNILAMRLDENSRRKDRKPIQICTAKGAQDNPDVAYCAGRFLICWSDLRSESDYDIWAALLDLNGKLVKKPFKLAGGKGGQARPAIAADGTGTFLVVWQDFSSSKYFDIRGLRIEASSGKVLDAQPIVCMHRGEEPAVAWTGKNFAVSQKWYAALVEPDGSISMKSTRLWRPRAIHHPVVINAWGTAKIFFNTEPKHDPWGWGGGGAIIGISLAPDGKSPEAGWIGRSKGKLKRVSDAAKSDGKIRNCLDAARWRNHSGWPCGMPGGFKSTQEGTWPSGRVAAAYNGRSILVAWNRAHIADKSRLVNRDLYLRRVTSGWSYPDAVKIPIALGKTDEVSPVLCAGRTGRALLVYERAEPQGGISIVYRLIVETEDQTGPSVVAIRRWSPTSFSVVFDEPVDPVSASVAANYQIEGLAITSARFDDDNRTAQRQVLLVTEAAPPGKQLLLKVTGVKDRSERGNTSSGKPFKFTVKPAQTSRSRFIDRWNIVGPFPHSWQTTFLKPAQTRPTPGDEIEHDGKKIKWQAVATGKGAILPFSKYYGNKGGLTGFANAYVFSPVARKAFLLLDATDGHQAWINGRLVSSDLKGLIKGRGLHDRTDRQKISLKKGWNQLLIQQSNKFGRWQLTARLTDKDDLPLEDLCCQLENPFK
jgi:hypothetical protein